MIQNEASLQYTLGGNEKELQKEEINRLQKQVEPTMAFEFHGVLLEPKDVALLVYNDTSLKCSIFHLIKKVSTVQHSNSSCRYMSNNGDHSC